MATPLSVSIVTFNAGRRAPDPRYLAAYLLSSFRSSTATAQSATTSDLHSAQTSATVPDILVFCIQEVAPLPDSFLSSTGNAGYLQSYFKAYEDAAQLAASSANAGGQRPSRAPRYECLARKNIGMTALLVLAHNKANVEVQWTQTAGVGFGFGGIMGNKGAVAVRFGLQPRATRQGDKRNSALSLTFVSAHLAPMEWATERRNRDWEALVRGLVFEDDTASKGAGPGKQSAEHADDTRPLLQADERSDLPHPEISGIYALDTHLFVAGDLNYRTSSTAPTPADARYAFPEPCPDDDTSFPRHHWHLFTASDQLTQEMKAGRTFQGLLEHSVDFPPTYKYSDKARHQMGKLLATSFSADAVPSDDEDASDVSQPLLLSSSPNGNFKANTSTAADIDITRPLPETPWDWAQHRWPSWCDRILYLPALITPATSSSLSSSSTTVTQDTYTALPLLPSSDHRPVNALFLVSRASSSSRQPASTQPKEDVHLSPPYPLSPPIQRHLWRSCAVGLEVTVGGAMKVYSATTSNAGKNVVLVSMVTAVVGGIVWVWLGS